MNQQSGFKIVFMGSPEFAAFSLNTLIENGFNICGVVTVPDKPAGRGLAMQQTAVKKLALAKGLKLVQPPRLKAPDFINILKELQPSLIIVVAFRILPEEVFSIPGKGTVNLHASLLPQYRGAAPINHAIINGEKITGLTTFFIEKQVDTGKIIFQEKVEISDRDNAGTLHDKLMNIGAKLLVKTVAAIMNNNYQAHDQAESLADAGVLKTAPKIHTENCRINWSMAVTDIYNFIRGLSPYPTAYTEITDKKGNVVSLKIFESQKVFEDHKLAFGTILTDSKTYFKIAVKSGFILIQNLQAAGRKRMNTEDFLRGFRIGEWIIKT